MTTVQTRVREIGDQEGFDIIVTQNGTPVDVRANGVLGKYQFDRKLKGTKTVAEWKRDRFEATYPGYSCDILNGDGSTAAGQTLIQTVRETYAGD